MIGLVSSKIPEWETYIGSPVVNFSLCAKYVLICSKDSTIRFLNVRTGTPALPILHMPSPVIISVFVCIKLESTFEALSICFFFLQTILVLLLQSINSELGGIVTECGQIRVWNLTKGSIYVKATCHDLFPSTATTTAQVCYFYITETGILYIILSNGNAYSYSKQLDTW